MTQKNKTLLIVAFAIITFVLVASVFLYKPITQKLIQKPPQKEEITGDLPVLTCTYPDDQAAYTDAITKQNVNQCSCVKDEKLQEMCKFTTMDLTIYSEAVKQFDQKKCENIRDDSRKSACLMITKSGVDYLKENDPQYLVNINANAHNKDAIEGYESLLQSDPNNVKNLISLALAYAENGLKDQEQGKNQDMYVEKALTVIAKAKTIDANNSEVYRIEGYAYEIKPDYDRSLAAYNKSIELSGDNIFAYAGRGHLNRIFGKTDEAIVDFNKAAELDRDKEYAFTYSNLCNLQYSQGNIEEAVKNCKIVTTKESIDPMFQSEAYQIMAIIFMDRRDYVQARNYLLTAKTLTPDDSNLYVTFARIDLLEKNYSGSEASARKVIELSPTKSMGYLALSHALYMQEKYDASMQAAQKGIELVKDDVSLLVAAKSGVEGDLNYSIANNYRQMGNSVKQSEYEKKGSALFNQSLK